MARQKFVTDHPRQSRLFDLQPLEARQLLSATPASVLTMADRAYLLSKWNGPNKATLQSFINNNDGAGFDASLLSYMQGRTGANVKFFFKPSDVAADASYIKTNFNTASIVANADSVVNHLFPDQTNAVNYTVQLPAGDIDWLHQPGTTSNPEFLYGLNRMGYWMELGQAYRFSGDSKYATELTS